MALSPCLPGTHSSHREIPAALEISSDETVGDLPKAINLFLQSARACGQWRRRDHVDGPTEPTEDGWNGGLEEEMCMVHKDNKKVSPDDRQKQGEREFEEGIMDAGNRAMKRLLEEMKSQRK